MDKELLKCLVDFYSNLENLDNKWKELLEKNNKTLECLKNQIEHLQCVTCPEADNSEVYQIEGLRDRLIFNIYVEIENEVTLIYKSLTCFKKNIQDLKNLLIRLEKLRSKLTLKYDNMNQLEFGTTRRPKLNLLLEWSIDATDYYQNIYFQIRNSLYMINYKDEKSIDRLVESFHENETLRIKIDRILAHTQFLLKKS